MASAARRGRGLLRRQRPGAAVRPPGLEVRRLIDSGPIRTLPNRSRQWSAPAALATRLITARSSPAWICRRSNSARMSGGSSAATAAIVQSVWLIGDVGWLHPTVLQFQRGVVEQRNVWTSSWTTSPWCVAVHRRRQGSRPEVIVHRTRSRRSVPKCHTIGL